MTNRQAAIEIIRKLRQNGFEALLAGGCVRDMLLRRPAKDYDVVTNAKPAEVMQLFRRTIEVGVKFGVVIALIGEEKVEVATFRTETDYADGRHPGKVRFATAKEDAARRDFTINAMFYDPLQQQVIDFFGGRGDLKRRIIRTVGKPEDRFGEDFLRMLRAVRFSAQLGFEIEPQTKEAICNNAKNIIKISSERIAMELEGLLVCPNRAAGAEMLVETQLAQAIFPAFAAQDAMFGIESLRHLPARIDFPLGLACLFAGCTTESALKGYRTLRLSRNQDRHIEFLLANRGKLLNEQMSLAQLKMTAAEPCFEDLFELQKAIQKTKGESAAALAKLRKRIEDLGDIELRPKPLLDGHDLIRLGATPGPSLGQLTKEMYIAQLEGHLRTAKQAERWVLDWLDRHK